LRLERLNQKALEKAAKKKKKLEERERRKQEKLQHILMEQRLKEARRKRKFCYWQDNRWNCLFKR